MNEFMNGKDLITEGFQLTNVEGMLKLGNHLLTNTMAITVSGHSHEWMLKSGAQVSRAAKYSCGLRLASHMRLTTSQREGE